MISSITPSVWAEAVAANPHLWDGRVLGLSDDPVAGLSASRVRADPAAHWAYLPPPVQAHYRRTVCLHGAESTGKTTLAQALGERLARPDRRVAVVGEYLREFCDAQGRTPRIDEKTAPDDYRPLERLPLMRFDGRTWVLFGPVDGR